MTASLDFAGRAQTQGESPQDGIRAWGDNRREIQSGAQARVTPFGEAGFAAHRRARGMLAWGQPSKGGQLRRRLSNDLNIADFSQEFPGSDVANAGNGGEQITLLTEDRG